MENYTIANATKDELNNYYNIQHGVGWDPIYKSQQFFEATDMNGCFFGKLEGKIISSITAMKYGRYGFIGLYWVKKEYRGKGYGFKIFQRGMEYLKDCDIVGLDSVEEQVKNYEKLGFKVQYKSIKGYTKKKPEFQVEIKSRIVTDKKLINVEQVGVFDRLYFPSDRTSFLSKAFSLGTPIVSYDKQTNKIKGYGIVNKLQFGVCLAPLVADSAQTAEEIISTMFDTVKTESYVLFYSDEYEDVLNVGSLWFPQEMFYCQRMYRKKNEDVQDFERANVFGVSSFERG